MNVQVRSRPAPPQAASKLAIADCDLHLGPASLAELYPWMEKRWQEHIETYGASHRTGMQDGLPSFPKAQPAAARRDAWPPSGRPPGTDIEFTRAQHLDPQNVALGLINPPLPSSSFMNPGLGNAVCRAMNEFQVECLVKPEPRLRASVVVNYEDTQGAVAEIERCAGNPAYGHVLLFSRTGDPMGTARYFPIFEAAVAAGLPVAVHAFGFGGNRNTSSGWASFYMEDMIGHAQSCQAQLTSMVVEGVFERLPKLRFVLIEGGFAWLPSLAWRLDRNWKTLRSETPHLSRAPSEYIREQVWLTTQPMEEPEPREHLLDTIAWIGWDRLLFASDYPHWDFDDPAYALPLRITEQQRQMFFRDNARLVYGL
ncbi:MAG TPA: amidohydrolase family protein [Acetobacteraceae bacterium]|nr:amidohydrolase family protein [Acetobacteraceae bacterium]